jgi:uncharacterized protein (DUF2236 family)
MRGRVGAQIFQSVAGPEGPAHHEVIFAPDGERWFAEDRPIRRVHGDSSMFVGGLRALLLQSLHPLAMAAVAGHSGYKGDPWGRLQRTSYFLAVTTFGRVDDAQATITRVRSIHERVTGVAADGRPYAAADPHLLTWVHIAEADSFLRAHTRFGAEPLDQAGRDGYVADVARIGAALGVPDPPLTERDLKERIEAYRGELASTPEARAAARFLLLSRPWPGRRTGCWPGPRCRCCPGGPGGRCGCRGCRWPRRRWSGRPGRPWWARSGGPRPRPARPRRSDGQFLLP